MDFSSIKDNQRMYLGIVSSLLLDGNRLFVGKGNYLSVYDTDNDTQIGSYQLFDSNKITGIKQIALNQLQVLFVIAQKEVKYAFHKKKETLQSGLNFKLFQSKSKDYCLDVCPIPGFLCLGFMNNYIEIHSFRINSFDYEQSINAQHVKTIFCCEKSIVYSLAMVYEDFSKELITASGTVFRRIVIWTLSIKNNESIEITRSLALTGHEGVIFSVRFVGDSTLISTSDDRTARLWKYDLNHKTFHCDTFYGHAARVWDSCSYLPKGIFVTISEDTTARLYDTSTNCFLFDLSSGHYGKGIRSAVMNSNYIWTGGEDGQIIKWSYQQLLLNSKSKASQDNVTDCLFASYALQSDDSQCKLAKAKQHNFKPSIKVIYFLDESNILIGTNHGQVLNYFIKYKSISSLLFSDKETRVINSIEVISKEYLITGLSDGNIQLTSISESSKQKTIRLFNNIRIPSIFHKVLPESKELFIIASTALGKSKVYYVKDYTTLSYEELERLFSQSNTLEINPGSRFLKAISSLEIIKRPHNTFIVFMGDYEGHLYYATIKVISSYPYCFSGVKYLTIHNKDKITKLFFIEQSNILHTLSRDGTLKKFVVLFNSDSNSEAFTLKELDSQFKKDINSYEAILYQNELEYLTGRYYIIGHFGRKLLVFDNERNIIIHSNDVKGVNRPLDLKLIGDHIVYAYSNAETMTVATVPLSSNSINTKDNVFLKSYSTPLNGRLIHFTNLIHLNSDNYLFTTSAEDTKVNFYLLKRNDFFNKGSDLLFLNQFTRHQCSIRKTRLIKKETVNDHSIQLFFISIASKSEAFLFKINISLHEGNSEISLLCDLTVKSELNETRNMNVALYHYKQSNNLLISFTNTISVTWSFIFNWSKQLFAYEEKKAIVNTKTNFIALSLAILASADDKEVVLIHGLVNGHLNLISLNNADEVNVFYKVHEAGINDIKVLDDKYVFSCGEDFSVCVCEISNLKELKVVKVIRKIHFSAIKAIEVIRSEGSKVVINSGSYDQSICFCEYDLINQTWRMMKRIRTCVAEINSISLVQVNEKEVVWAAAGQGVELFNYDITS